MAERETTSKYRYNPNWVDRMLTSEKGGQRDSTGSVVMGNTIEEDPSMSKKEMTRDHGNGGPNGPPK